MCSGGCVYEEYVYLFCFFWKYSRLRSPFEFNCYKRIYQTIKLWDSLFHIPLVIPNPLSINLLKKVGHTNFGSCLIFFLSDFFPVYQDRLANMGLSLCKLSCLIHFSLNTSLQNTSILLQKCREHFHRRSYQRIRVCRAKLCEQVITLRCPKLKNIKTL